VTYSSCYESDRAVNSCVTYTNISIGNTYRW